MPRPKRIGRPPAADRATQGAISAIPARISSPKPSSTGNTTTSDDSDGLVRRKPGATRADRSVAPQMSGALPADEASVVPARGRPKIARHRPQRGPARMAQEDEAATRAIDELRKRMAAAERGKMDEKDVRVAGATLRQTAPQVENLQEEPQKRGGVERRIKATTASQVPSRRVSAAPMSVRKPMSTPRAEASMLALANFRRRSRAPSILGIGKDDETASISSDGSLGDLMPDDESTPLPLPQARVPQQAHNQTHQFQSSPMSADPNLIPSSSSSRKRKRGSTDVLVPNSQPSQSVLEPPGELAKTFVEIPSEESESSELSDASLPVMPMSEPNPAEDGEHSSTMAPPASSSSPNRLAGVDGRHKDPSPLQNRTRRRNAGGGIAANWTRGQASGKGAKSGVLDTAALQGLLPKRKQKKGRDEGFEIYDSDVSQGRSEDDEDELSFAPSKRRTTTNAAKKQRTALAEKKGPAKNAGTARGRRTVKATPANKRSRTYSRRLSEKENADLSSEAEVDGGGIDVSQISPAAERASDSPFRPSKELRAMVRKFAEIDEWKMDFEEITSSSSDLRDAR